MTKVVQLTTWERIQMRNMLLAQPTGNTFQEAHWGSSFIDALDLSESERVEIGFIPLGSGGRWNLDKDSPWDTSLSENVWRFAFGRLLHPQAVGWSYDRERNEAMKVKMETIVKELNE